MKGHIRERSPGRWAIVLDVHDPATGKRKRRWHSFSGNKRGAQVECARLISLLNGGSYLEPNKTTVAHFLDRWLDDIKSKVAPRTHERYMEIARANISPLIGNIVGRKVAASTNLCRLRQGARQRQEKGWRTFGANGSSYASRPKTGDEPSRAVATLDPQPSRRSRSPESGTQEDEYLRHRRGSGIAGCNARNLDVHPDIACRPLRTATRRNCRTAVA